MAKLKHIKKEYMMRPEETIIELGDQVIKEKYGNLFEMYEKITGENPYKVPMRIYPAVHYTMGGLWVDYELMTTVPGLYCLGEANFSDHGANRLGASALMQGLGGWIFCDSIYHWKLHVWRDTDSGHSYYTSGF